MVTVVPADEGWGQAFSNLGKGLTEGYMGRSDEMAIQKAIQELGSDASPRDILNALTNTRTYRPESKQTALKNYLNTANFEELQRKAQAQEEIAKEKNKIAASKVQTPDQMASAYGNYISRGYKPAEARSMVDPNVTKATKQYIAGHVEDEISRKLRSTKQDALTAPQEEMSQGVEDVQVAEDQELVEAANEINQVAPTIEAAEQYANNIAPVRDDAWPDLPAPKDMKPSELVKWRDSNQKFNSKELKENREKTKANRDALIHYSRLQQLNDTGKVQNGLSRALIDPETGEPYRNVSKLNGVNKETQQYVKTLNDFISQAKNFFGARVTNFDLSSFKARLPSLLNTEEGRRSIIEQMRLLTELEAVHDTALSDGLKHYKDNASYLEISKAVDDRVSGKEQQIINKINHLDTASKYLDMIVSRPKYKDMELLYNPESEDFIAARPSDAKALQAKGYDLWRTPL